VSKPAAGAAPLKNLLVEARTRTDAILGEWAGRLESEVPGVDGKGLAYALAGPGKRIRPALVMASYRAVGGDDPSIALLAAAVETVHTYSLVHDDLPCMDDDDLRRGRPTTHVAFDISVATRVGFRLVPVAALMIVEGARRMGLPSDRLGQIAAVLFQASGIEGMVGGQWLDLAAEHQELDLAQLRTVHRGKTGALIRASCVIGGVAAGASQKEVDALAAYGEDVGLAFQVADDVLDTTGTSDQLGKTAGRDEALRKSTYVKLLGVSGAKAEAESLAQRATQHLADGGVSSGALTALAEYIVNRES
jgi:geranylgeranyl pyrophosphate synthase